MPERRWLPILEATLDVVIWGVTFVSTKIVLRQITPTGVVWVRFGIGMLLLGGVTWARGLVSWPSKNDIPYLALIGFIGITFHQ